MTTRGAVLSFARDSEAPPISTRRPVAHAEPDGLPSEPWTDYRPRAFELEEARALTARRSPTREGVIESPDVTAEQVDELLGEVLERVAEAVAEERDVLRTALQGGRLSTDEVRLALRRCRGLLDELLEI